jgi:hypothetical protein
MKSFFNITVGGTCKILLRFEGLYCCICNDSFHPYVWSFHAQSCNAKNLGDITQSLIFLFQIQVVINKAMNHKIPWTQGNFWTRWEIISFSRMILLHQDKYMEKGSLASSEEYICLERLQKIICIDKIQTRYFRNMNLLLPNSALPVLRKTSQRTVITVPASSFSWQPVLHDYLQIFVSVLKVCRSKRQTILYVQFEVFTAVTMKNAVFCGVAPCRCGRLNRRFGG